MPRTSLAGLGVAVEGSGPESPLERDPVVRLAGVGKVLPPGVASLIPTAAREAFGEASEIEQLRLDPSICGARPCTNRVVEERVRAFLGRKGLDDLVFGVHDKGWWVITRRERIRSDYSVVDGNCRFADDSRAECLADQGWGWFTFQQKCYFTRYIIIDVSENPVETAIKGKTYDQLRAGPQGLPPVAQNKKIDPTKRIVTWLQYYHRTCSNSPTVALKPPRKTIDRTEIYGLVLKPGQK